MNLPQGNGELSTWFEWALGSDKMVRISWRAAIGFEWPVNGQIAQMYAGSKPQARTLTLPQVVILLAQLDLMLVAQRKGILAENATRRQVGVASLLPIHRYLI